MVAPTSVHEQADSGQHQLRPVGYLHGSRGTRLVRQHPLPPDSVPHASTCERPMLWACERRCCLAARPCQCHRESKCAPCSTRYRRRFSRLIEEGLRIKVQQAGGFSYLLTLNAPGDEGHQRWIAGKRGLHGACDCWQSRLDGDDLWNGSAAQRWNRVRTRLRQLVPGLEYVRAVEVQKRGLIHHHVVLWSPVPLDAGTVQSIAVKAGYGCVFDLGLLDSPSKMAGYLAKYVTKALDQRCEVPWRVQRVNVDTGEVTDDLVPTYRAGQASQGWAMKMWELREAARRSAAIGAARRREYDAFMATQAATDDVSSHVSGAPPPS
jgi:hypothetical protein